MSTKIKAIVTFDMKADNDDAAIDALDAALGSMYKRNMDQIEEIHVDWEIED
jgi:hypothetical protein